MQSEAHTPAYFPPLNFLDNFCKHLTEKQMLLLIGVLPGDRGQEDLKLPMDKGGL